MGGVVTGNLGNIKNPKTVTIEPIEYDSEFAASLGKRGGAKMSLEELNYLRRQYIDATGPWTCADGSVVPEAYTKLRALFKTYSFGLGWDTTDDCFDFFKANFSEDEAWAYLDMPMGVTFTAYEYAQASGRDEKFCEELCDALYKRGLLYRTVRAGVANYNQVAVMHGMIEYNLDRFNDVPYFLTFVPVRTEGWMQDMMDSGTPFYRSLPIEAEVVGEGKILPLDDWREIIDRNDILAVSPCQCRRPPLVLSGENPPDTGDPALVNYDSPTCGHKLETCITTGEEAQYYLDKGIARPITKAEAVSIIEQSIDQGMVPQSMYTRDSEVICNCHSDCCAVLSTYLAMGPDYCATASCYPNVSDYNLTYDVDKCVGCGSCVKRCPMTAITMGEDGKPVTNAMCIRCGQCVKACPADARMLVVKAEEDRPFVPKTLLDGYNTLAAYRFERGMHKPQGWKPEA